MNIVELKTKLRQTIYDDINKHKNYGQHDIKYGYGWYWDLWVIYNKSEIQNIKLNYKTLTDCKTVEARVNSELKGKERGGERRGRERKGERGRKRERERERERKKVLD